MDKVDISNLSYEDQLLVRKTIQGLNIKNLFTKLLEEVNKEYSLEIIETKKVIPVNEIEIKRKVSKKGKKIKGGKKDE